MKPDRADGCQIQKNKKQPGHMKQHVLMWMCTQESNSQGYIGPVNCGFMFASAALDSIHQPDNEDPVKYSTSKHKFTVNGSNVSVWIAFLSAHPHEYVLFHVEW